MQDHSLARWQSTRSLATPPPHLVIGAEVLRGELEQCGAYIHLVKEEKQKWPQVDRIREGRGEERRRGGGGGVAGRAR